MDAEYICQLTETGLTYELKNCALLAEMEKPALKPDLKAPHYVLNIICQILVQIIDPALCVEMSKAADDLYVIKVMTAPVFDGAALN
jgi:hypothetical protein